jgi:hypothetical protein
MSKIPFVKDTKDTVTRNSYRCSWQWTIVKTCADTSTDTASLIPFGGRMMQQYCNQRIAK